MNKLKLADREWGEFFIGGESGIFSIKATKSGIDKNKLNTEIGNIPYITRTDIDNGINLFITGKQNDKYKQDGGNVITIGLDTQTVFYQQNSFYTGQNIQILTCDKLNKQVAMFIIPLLKIQMQKFSWGGNGATLGRLNRTKIMLPKNKYNEPDWQFMEEYIKQIEQDKIKQLVGYYQAKLLDSQLKNDIGGGKILQIQWDSFSIQDICQIHSGKDIYEKERVSGKLPYITATANNNGIGYFVDNHNSTLEQGCISVNRNGSVGYSFYHDYPALFGNDTRKLIPKNKNKYCSIFIALCITSQKDKYGYGYKMGTARLNKQKIMLPIDKNGNPNWQFMEDFIKNIEKDKIETLLSYLNQHNVLAEPSRAEPSRAEPSRAEPSRAEPSRNSMGEI